MFSQHRNKIRESIHHPRRHCRRHRHLRQSHSAVSPEQLDKYSLHYFLSSVYYRSSCRFRSSRLCGQSSGVFHHIGVLSIIMLFHYIYYFHLSDHYYLSSSTSLITFSFYQSSNQIVEEYMKFLLLNFSDNAERLGIRIMDPQFLSRLLKDRDCSDKSVSSIDITPDEFIVLQILNLQVYPKSTLDASHDKLFVCFGCFGHHFFLVMVDLDNRIIYFADSLGAGKTQFQSVKNVSCIYV